MEAALGMEQHIAHGFGNFPLREVALGSIFQRSYATAYAVAIRITRNPVDAQDVVQSVFCKLWASQSRIRFEQIDSLLKVATRNAAIDLMRKNARERAGFASDGAQQRTIPSAEDEAIKALDCDDLACALEQLAGENRELLLESFIAERSHAKIACARAMALGTVKSRIRSSLKRLHRLMAD